MSLSYIDPIQVIAREVADGTGAGRLEAFKTARKVQLALRKAGFAITRRRWVDPREIL